MHAVASFLPEEQDAIQTYLASIYEGVFSDSSLESHYRNHAELEFARYTTQVIEPRLKKGASLLDIGSGFGSCVLAARNSGFDAVGIEISEFEVIYARKRLQRIRPDDDAQTVYLQGDFLDFNFQAGCFDAVTLWNVLEHIGDCRSVLGKVARLLKRGGIVFIICPNYMAWRQEAHYHVPWKPSLIFSKSKGVEYLTSLGRNSDYFESSIHYRTNREVLGLLSQLGFEVRELGTFENREISLRRLPAIMRRPIKHARLHNPFRHSVEVAACKT
jgi:MPBQ/MSBQ methyltransferase